MRVRGVLLGAPAEAVSGSLTLGMRVFTEDAAITDEGGPVSFPHGDWMLYDEFLYTASPVLPGPGRPLVEIDVKSARKFEELGQGLLLSLENTTSSAIDVTGTLSIGLKLP